MGASVEHLQRHLKTGRLSFRRAFPVELRPYIPNQPVELKRSLGASSISEPKALERFQAAAAEYDVVVTRAGKQATRSFDRLEEPSIAYLAKIFERGLHQGAEQAVKDGEAEKNLHGWEWLTDDFRQWRREQDFDAVEEQWGASAGRLLEGQGLLVDPLDRQGFRKLCMALNEAAIAASLEAKARLSGYVIPIPPEPEAPVSAAAPGSVVAPGESATVAELIKAFRSAKDTSVSSSARAAYDASFRLMKGVVGAERRLGTLSRADGLALFEAVRSLPRNLGKIKALRGLSVPEAIARGRELGLPTISPKTINDSYVANLRSLFRWATRNDWMAKSPLPDEAATVDPVAPEEKRDPFTDEQLRTIFGSQPWVTGVVTAEKAIHYWAPLIALFMGLRRGEIAQLRVQDFSTADNIPMVSVAADAGLDGRSRKTANARRRIAVHHELIRLGLLQFVEHQKENGRELWPDERPDRRGRWGDGLSDWFTRLLSKRDVSGRRLGMHSFRHNFEDRLREADLQGTGIGAYIAGRRPGDRVAAGYGHGYSAAKHAAAMRRIKYPGLDMSAVRPWSSRGTLGSEVGI
jgi:integrase